MTEEWRPVVGYEGLYEVSNLGRVKSLPRFKVPVARILRTPLVGAGYPCVRLYIRGKATVRTVLVHTMVAEAFLGPRPTPKHQVCHGDGTRTNNRVENLRWGTNSDNVQDAIRHGTHKTATRPACAQGHLYTPENTNTYELAGGGRKRCCKTCAKEYRRRRIERLNSERAA